VIVDPLPDAGYLPGNVRAAAVAKDRPAGTINNLAAVAARPANQIQKTDLGVAKGWGVDIVGLPAVSRNWFIASAWLEKTRNAE
jgi:hypothetical protein